MIEKIRKKWLRERKKLFKKYKQDCNNEVYKELILLLDEIDNDLLKIEVKERNIL